MGKFSEGDTAKTRLAHATNNAKKCSCVWGKKNNTEIDFNASKLTSI